MLRDGQEGCQAIRMMRQQREIRKHQLGMPSRKLYGDLDQEKKVWTTPGSGMFLLILYICSSLCLKYFSPVQNLIH